MWEEFLKLKNIQSLSCNKFQILWGKNSPLCFVCFVVEICFLWTETEWLLKCPGAPKQTWAWCFKEAPCCVTCQGGFRGEVQCPGTWPRSTGHRGFASTPGSRSHLDFLNVDKAVRNALKATARAKSGATQRWIKETSCHFVSLWSQVKRDICFNEKLVVQIQLKIKMIKGRLKKGQIKIKIKIIWQIFI